MYSAETIILTGPSGRAGEELAFLFVFPLLPVIGMSVNTELA